MADHSRGADDKQSAKIAISLLRDAAETLSVTARVLFRGETEPSCELAPGAELAGFADGGHDRRGGDHADARNGRQAPACFILAMPFVQDLVELSQFVFQFEEPANQRCHRHLRHLRNHGLWIVLVEDGTHKLYEAHHTRVADAEQARGEEVAPTGGRKTPEAHVDLGLGRNLGALLADKQHHGECQ